MLSMGSTYTNNAYAMYPAMMMGQMPAAGMSQSPDMGTSMQMAGQMLMQSGSLYNSAMNLLGSAQSPAAYPTPFYTPPIAAMPVVCFMPVICQVPVMAAPNPMGMSMMPGASLPSQPTQNPFIPPVMPHPPIMQQPVQTPPIAQPEPALADEQFQMLSYLLPLLMELLQQLSTPTDAVITPDDAIIPPAEEEELLPPPPPPPAPTYNGGIDGRYWGDPHLEGFDGEKYDVMGQPGKTYNMLSDKTIQYNTTFEKWGSNGATIISQAGIQVGDDKIFFDRSGAAPTINGQAMTTGGTATLANGSTASWDGKKLIVKTSEYTIDLQVKDQNNPNGAYLDSHVSINETSPFADFVAPHGLLGQTADGVDGKKDTGIDQGKQGGRVIDGTVDDYEVTDLWSNPATFNRFRVTIGQIIQNKESNLVETVLDVDGNLLFQAPSISIAA